MAELANQRDRTTENKKMPGRNTISERRGPRLTAEDVEVVLEVFTGERIRP